MILIGFLFLILSFINIRKNTLELIINIQSNHAYYHIIYS